MQTTAGPAPLALREGRFARLEAIEWWDQSLLERSRVLVIGAGALGNEVLKNLALLGVGHVAVVDMDHVEMSNLSRSVLFRESDEGRSKAACAARAAKNIFPAQHIHTITGNVLADIGLGWFRWADAVIGALDNREARVFVNSACSRVNRPWFDGGIEVLNGVVRGFAPPRTACYECTMNQTDWDLINKRRSCSLLARRAIANRGTPTTPTTASIIGAMQVQEMIKHLHGREALLGRGFVFEGTHHSSYSVQYPLNPDCPWHEQPVEILEMTGLDSSTPLQAVWDEATRRLGGLDALDFAREIVSHMECSKCGSINDIWQPLEKIDEAQARCSRCGFEQTPGFIHSLTAKSDILKKSAREIGLPMWEIIWARKGVETIAIEFSGDRAKALNSSEPSP